LRSAPIKIADLLAIDHFVTDNEPDKRVRQVLETSKTALHIAGEN
jgi:DeoR/GlpR family transcriptional regulator of sugar metabolism